MWQRLDEWDRRTLERLQRLPGEALWRPMALGCSRSGDGPGYLVLALILAELGGPAGQDFTLAGLAAFAIELPCYWILKNGLQRARPCHGLAQICAAVTPPDRFSLPSGHSAAAFLIATLLALFWPTLTLPALLWASGVALSRVLLGVHYPGDVLLGALLGSGAAMLGWSWVH